MVKTLCLFLVLSVLLCLSESCITPSGGQPPKGPNFDAKTIAPRKPVKSIRPICHGFTDKECQYPTEHCIVIQQSSDYPKNAHGYCQVPTGYSLIFTIMSVSGRLQFHSGVNSMFGTPEWTFNVTTSETRTIPNWVDPNDGSRDPTKKKEMAFIAFDDPFDYPLPYFEVQVEVISPYDKIYYLCAPNAELCRPTSCPNVYCYDEPFQCGKNGRIATSEEHNTNDIRINVFKSFEQCSNDFQRPLFYLGGRADFDGVGIFRFAQRG